MLGDPVFAERFARFTNGELNPQPGVSVAQDASYTLARYVLTNKKPWSELFVTERLRDRTPSQAMLLVDAGQRARSPRDSPLELSRGGRQGRRYSVRRESPCARDLTRASRALPERSQLAFARGRWDIPTTYRHRGSRS